MYHLAANDSIYQLYLKTLATKIHMMFQIKIATRYKYK